MTSGHDDAILAVSVKNCKEVWWPIIHLQSILMHQHTKIWVMYWLSTDCNGAPCGFTGRFEDVNFSLKIKMKIYSSLHWRIKMWRIRISCMLKNEDQTLPHFLKTKTTFLKNVEDWRFKIWRSLLKMLKMERKWRPGPVKGAPVMRSTGLSTHMLTLWSWSWLFDISNGSERQMIAGA